MICKSCKQCIYCRGDLCWVDEVKGVERAAAEFGDTTRVVCTAVYCFVLYFTNVEWIREQIKGTRIFRYNMPISSDDIRICTKEQDTKTT